MDAATRAANVAQYGDSHKKEAQGLQLIFDALQKDGCLEFHKSFEGARADFCVYKSDEPGAPALGVQLKTTGVNQVRCGTGYESYRFTCTSGYTDLLLIFVALHEQPKRIWLADGSRVVSNSVQIPVEFQKGIKTDRVREVDLSTVAGAVYAIYLEAVSGISNYVLRSPVDHERPTEGSKSVEYYAFKHLQRSLPVLFIDPPAEHMPYDYLVDGMKWQLKLARHCNKHDKYYVTCFKNAGKVGDKMTFRQYEVDDFDFLCIQLPEKTVDCCYVIPQGVLAEHRLIGDNKSCGTVTLYPHRALARRYVHEDDAHWAEAYRIDFADDPLAKLARNTQGWVVAV